MSDVVIPDEVSDAFEIWRGGIEGGRVKYPLKHIDAYAAGARWAFERGREQALEEAQSAVARCGYVFDNDRTAFPSQRAVDQWEALDAIRALAQSPDQNGGE